MIRRGCAQIKWASRQDPSSSSLSACRWCQQARTVYATRGSSQEDKAVTGKSAMDELFDAPDAFDHDTGMSKSLHKGQREGYKSQKVPRTVLGTDLSSNIASQLNQEWEGAPAKKHNVYQPSRSRTSLRGPDNGKQKRSFKGTMTPSEAKTFSNIFENFFSNSATNQATKPVDEGAFGSSLTNNSPGTLDDFKTRNRLQERRQAARKRYLSSVLSERVSSANISEDEIEAKIDEAREEIVGCSSVSELWQWAVTNVWGMKSKVQEQGVPTLIKRSREVGSMAEDTTEEVATSSTIARTSEVEEEDVRFGRETPYYSPVLLLLLTNLRDRFHSPQSALSVLRITKNLGPDSFVLGCSPQLYAEAIRTQWIVLRDLEGARDTLREAKDTGVLGRGGSPVQLLSDRTGSKDSDEESRLREIISRHLKSDVQSLVIEGVKRLPEGQIPLVYERQLDLVADIDEILGTYKRPAPVKPYRRPTLGY